MRLSKAQLKTKEFYDGISKKQKEPIPLTDEQYENLLSYFYKTFCEKHGFYISLNDSLTNNGYFIYKWQHDIIDAYFTSVFKQKSMDINISILRQVGKTEIVALCTAFIFEQYYNEFGKHCHIAIFAPVKKTATIMFRRATQYINKKLFAQDGDSKEKKESIRGDLIELFGIYDETKGSTVEGNTFDIIIRDEAHLGNDVKFTDETEPTRFSKKAPIIRIGNGGKKECDFYRSINMGNFKDEKSSHEVRLIRYTYTEVKPYFEKLAAAGVSSAKTRIDNIDHYIKKNGLLSMDVQKNIFCKWMLEYSNIISTQQLQRCAVPVTEFKKGVNTLYVAIDFATSYDRTVATIMDDERSVIDWVIIKEKNTQARIREQCESFRAVCEERGYMDDMVACAFDATGVGAGGVVELLEDFFSCDLVPYKFSSQRKHDWYVAALESLATDYDIDRVKLPELHPCYKLFVKEWIELERHELPEQKYDVFRAPKREGYFDDFVASYAMCLDLMNTMGSFYKLERLENPNELNNDNAEMRDLLRKELNIFSKYSSLIAS